MGGQESKSAEFLEASALFSDGEQQKISELYQRLCRVPEKGISLEELKSCASPILGISMSEHLYLFMKSAIKSDSDHRRKLGVTQEEFVVALAALLKSTPEQRSSLFTCLTCGDENGTANVQQIQQVTQNLMDSYRKTLDTCPAYNLWQFPSDHTTQQFTRAVVHDLIHKGGTAQCDHPDPATALPADRQFEAWSMESWLSSSAILVHILEHVLYACFPVTFMNRSLRSFVPHIDAVDWTRCQSLLDFPSLIYLNHSLSPQYQGEWRLLYNSRIHGESFSTMVKRIKNKGPTVIIIRDTDQHVFGAHHTQSWALNANFVGSDRSLLFSLTPIMEVYSATSYNTNYVYLNQGQETLPNGIAFGGQFNYHGLWLDYDYGKGHSKAQPKCTTFNSPQLSGKPEFLVDAIEVWAVGPKSQDELDAQTSKPGSILDKDPAAKALLTMINKGPLSEGLREEDAKAESPEEHSMGPIGL